MNKRRTTKKGRAPAKDDSGRGKLDRMGRQLFEMRDARELSQMQVAEVSGLSQSDISRIERGWLADIMKIARYANAIRCTVQIVAAEPTRRKVVVVPPERDPVPPPAPRRPRKSPARWSLQAA